MALEIDLSGRVALVTGGSREARSLPTPWRSRGRAPMVAIADIQVLRIGGLGGD